MLVSRSLQLTFAKIVEMLIGKPFTKISRRRRETHAKLMQPVFQLGPRGT